MHRDDASLLDIDTAAKYILETSAGLSKIELMDNKDKVFSINLLSSAQLRSNCRYDKVDLDEIWDVIQRDIPALRKTIAPLLS